MGKPPAAVVGQQAAAQQAQVPLVEGRWAV